VAANEIVLRIRTEGEEVSEQAVEDLIEEIRRLRRAADQAADELNDMDNEGRNAGGSMRALKRGAAIAAGVGIAALAAATREVVAGMKEGIQVASEFQFAISKAAARTDATTQTLNTFSRVSKSASADSAFGANQAADALTEMSKAGFDAQQSAGALKGVLQQAAAAQTDVATASKVSTGILKSYGRSVRDLTEINDTLVKASTTSKTNVKDLGLSLGVVGSAANQAGMSLSRTTSILSKMQDKNLSASRSAIALRRAIAVMSDPTSQARKELKRMGIEVDKSASTADQLLHVFEELQDSGNKVGNMAQVFGVRAGPTLQAALSEGVSGIKAYSRSLEEAEGTTKKIAEFQLNNLMGQAKKLKGSFMNLVTDAFTPTTKELSRLAEMLLSSANAVQSNNKSMGSLQVVIGYIIKGFAILAQGIRVGMKAVTNFTRVMAFLTRAMEFLGLVQDGTSKGLRMTSQSMKKATVRTGALVRQLNQSSNAIRQNAHELQKTANSYTRLKNAVSSATQAIKANITAQQAQTRTKQTLQTVDALTKRWTQFQESVRKDMKNSLKNPDGFDVELSNDQVSRVKEMSGRMKELAKELDRVKQFNAGELNHLEGDQADKAHRLKKEIRSLNQEAFEMSNVFDAVASGEKNMRIGQMREKFIRFSKATAQSNAKMEKFAAILEKVKKEEGKVDPVPPGGGDGIQEEKTPLKLLRLKLKLERASKREVQYELKRKIAIFKVEQKGLDADREQLTLARKLEKLENQRKKSAKKRAKKAAELRGEALRAVELNQNQLAIQRMKLDTTGELSAQQKKRVARLKHETKLNKINQKFNEKERKLREKMKDLGKEGLADAQKQNLSEKRRLALLKRQQKHTQKLASIEAKRASMAQRTTSMIKGATEGMFNQLDVSISLSETEGARLGEFEKATGSVKKQMEGIKESIRGVKLGGTADSEKEKLNDLKAELELRKRILTNIKRSKETEKENLKQRRKEIEKLTQLGRSFQMVAAKSNEMSKGLEKVSKQGGDASNAFQTIDRLFAGPLKDADRRVKDVGAAFDGMTGTMSSAGSAAQGLAKAFGASLKTRAAIQAGFQSALGVARAAQAAMGNPAAAAAAASHFASAGMFAAISGRAPKKGGKSASAVGSAARSEAPSAEDIGKTIGEEINKQEPQGKVIINDFAGATLLEDSPGVQREIKNASASAKGRTIKRQSSANDRG